MSDSDSSRDSKSDLGMNGEGKKDNVCRDFLRNVCRRGQGCKYRHPEGSEAEGLGRRSDYMFCHDYQNRECRRSNCKFMHCTREEEQQYRATGVMPQHVLDAAKNTGLSGRSESYPGNGEAPICKDYLKGECRRGLHCKFRHLNPSEYDMDMDSGSMRGRQDMYSQYNSYSRYDSFEPEPKRRAFDDPYSSSMDPPIRRGDIARMMPSYSDLRILKEENMLLRGKVDELKKQFADLSATNEFLLDQNAQLRFSKQPAVTSVSQTLNPHSINPVVSMAAMTQLSLASSELTAQRMTTGSIGVPATLGQGIAPVSMGYPSFSQSMMSMGTHSSNLVSYPIMTQSIRPAMPHTLG